MSRSRFHETGGLPCQLDTKRDLWAKGTDFVYVSLAHAFKMDLVTWVLPFIFLRTSVWSIPVYFLCVATFVVPIFLLQSYLGQFSSSGYISIFRVAPLFKGMGYVSCALNFLLLTYQSIFAGIPLIFLWNSFRFPVPWSCESYENWGFKAGSSLTLCTAPLHNGSHFINDVDIPSVQFLRSHFQHTINEDLAFSWYLYLCLIVVWTIVGAIVWQRTPVFGRIIRVLVQISVVLLVVCLLRSLLLPGSWEAMSQYFSPESNNDQWPKIIPVISAITFSSGWGCTISMASFNRFNTNIIKYSWQTCALQVLVMFLMAMFSYLMESHMVEAHNLHVKGHFYKQHWELIMCIPSALAALELPQLWCVTFSLMLVLAAVAVLATQLHALKTALMDEFSELRHHRPMVTVVLVFSLALASSYFCFNHSNTFFSPLATDALFMQTSLNLLLLLIVLWIYGRHRFQQDFQFMLGRPFATWLLYLLRFGAPICALFVLWFCYLAIRHQHYFMSSFGLQLVAVLFVVLPWLLLPGYSLLKLLQATGSVCMRFRRVNRPTDWYPSQLENRQRYLEMIGDLDMNQELREIREIHTDQ